MNAISLLSFKWYSKNKQNNMKKLFTLATLLCFTFSVAHSQLSLRPQVGINFASFSNDLLDNEWSSNVGYQFGADLQMGSSLYLQPGVNFQITNLTFEGERDIDFTTQRFNIPIMVGYKFGEAEDATFGFRVFAGPNLAIHVSEDFDDAINGLDADDINDAHFSGMAGAGLDISFLFFDVIYKFGLGDYITIENQDTNKNVFILNAGIRIGF